MHIFKGTPNKNHFETRKVPFDALVSDFVCPMSIASAVPKSEHAQLVAFFVSSKTLENHSNHNNSTDNMREFSPSE